MSYLRSDLEKEWAGKDIYKVLINCSGIVYRSIESRRTFRFDILGKCFFAKVHFGVGWKAIVSELVRGRIPVLGAKNEWLALKRLKQLGVDTLTPAAFGEEGCNPAKLKSYLVTDELTDMVSLEEVCATWRVTPPSFNLKKMIIKKLADISRLMHSNGVNHRDFYLCHFYIPNHMLSTGSIKEKGVSLFVIDLHRAQLRSGKTPERWCIKDVSGLYYSSMDCGLTKGDLFRFIQGYTGVSLRKALKNKSFWKKVVGKAVKIQKRMDRKKVKTGY